MSASTVSLAYRELARRGLVVGETGRGTYVRAAAGAVGMALPEPSGSYVDLALNVPILPEQARLLAESLAPLLRRSTAFEDALRPVGVTGTAEGRRVAGVLLSRRGWPVDADRVIFVGSGKQALSAVVAALVRPGERLGVDTLTYPVVKAVAARQNVHLVPLRMDEQGMCPEALASAHLRTPLRAIYCQPVLHNPVGTTMPPARRTAIARVIQRHRLVAIEDTIYSFLAPTELPLAALAPDRVVLIDSFSKRLAPGISVGMIVAPERLTEPIASEARSGAYGPSGFALEACMRWVLDGTVAAIVAAKRKDAALRQRLLRRALAGLEVTSDPRSYHAWLTLPDGWRAERFQAAASSHGIAVVPGSAFSARPGHSPNSVRLALASPTTETLVPALETLADLARGGRAAHLDPIDSLRRA
jgi:DNA-binding transcriptional MocR family regulator